MKILDSFASAPSASVVTSLLSDIKDKVLHNNTLDVYKRCHSFIDLTTLSSEDSADSVREFARTAVAFSVDNPDIPPVASLCVYPPFVEVVGLEIDATPLKITSVAGGFPSSQTFLEVKALECAMAIESGADEVDVVLNVGMMLGGRADEAYAEIEHLRHEVGEDIVLKVIIESGALSDLDLIYKASLLAACAGADFVKTSTGKLSPAATPEAAVVICLAIKELYEKRGLRVGFKVAGGVRTADDAALYYTIVSEILGEDWLDPTTFRIGASTLSDAIVERIKALK